MAKIVIRMMHIWRDYYESIHYKLPQHGQTVNFEEKKKLKGSLSVLSGVA